MKRFAAVCLSLLLLVSAASADPLLLDENDLAETVTVFYNGQDDSDGRYVYSCRYPCVLETDPEDLCAFCINDYYGKKLQEYLDFYIPSQAQEYKSSYQNADIEVTYEIKCNNDDFFSVLIRRKGDVGGTVYEILEGNTFSRSGERIGTLTSLPVMLGILVITVLVKYWMSRFNRTLGERVNHTGLLAASKDSLNDVLATSGTILSLILSKLLPNVPVDGITASLVALYVFKSGYELASDIIGKLLGENADKALEQKITRILKDEPEVKGFHDLVIHDYGPGTRMGSAHVELDARLSLMEAHAIIDRCEEKILQECELMLTIHPDPLEEDESVSFWKRFMETILHAKDPEISVHDFRIRQEEDGILLQFDADIGYECAYSNKDLLNAVKLALADRNPPVRCRITFDRGHVSETLE